MAKATIKTIALEAGVSIATVSKALNDMPDVSDGVKARIREIARRQGYVTNAAARQLASGHAFSVGIIVPDISQHSTGLLFKSLSFRLQRAGYTTHLGNSEGDLKAEAALAVDMLEKGVGAILIVPCTSDMRHIEEAVNNRAPVVYAGGAVNPLAENAVALDEYKGGMMAAQELHQSGCRSCAILTWGAAATAQHERTRGFLAYMQEQGLSVSTCKGGEVLAEDAGESMTRALLQQGLPQGLFATDDLIALGALNALRLAGKRVPQDVKLIGYGDSPCAGLELVGLSSVAVPSNEVGICAADLLLGLLRADTDMVRKLTLEPSVVRRRSTSMIR